MESLPKVDGPLCWSVTVIITILLPLVRGSGLGAEARSHNGPFRGSALELGRKKAFGLRALAKGADPATAELFGAALWIWNRNQLETLGMSMGSDHVRTHLFFLLKQI